MPIYAGKYAIGALCWNMRKVWQWAKYVAITYLHKTDVPVCQWVCDADTVFQMKLVNFVHMIRYDTRCYFNVRSIANMSPLKLLHGNDN